MNAWLFVLLISIFNSAFASLPDLKFQITNKQYSKAIETGEALKKYNPNSVSVYFYTALAYQNNKQPELAKKYYLRALKINPQLPEAYNNLASIYAAEKDYTKAAKTLTDAINSQQNMATAYANLSKIYQHLASQAYRQVLDKDARKKQTKIPLRTQLLVSLDITETLLPIKSEVTKPAVNIAKAPIKTKAPTKIIPNVKPNVQKPISPSATQTIINWARAWETKQYDKYIKSYSNTYAPKNLTHTQWLAQRKKRIKRPGNISVTVNNFDLKLTKNKAYVNFDQSYRSPTYQDKVRKRMHLTLIDGQWRIISEVTLSVL